jgi:hypothetical protein
MALLSTAIQALFERKQHTLVSFLDISRAYDNVLIDILCEQMHQAQLPLKIVRVMWNLLCRKEMGFYFEGQPVAESVGFKGLPQGSALSSIFLWLLYFSRLSVFAGSLFNLVICQRLGYIRRSL